MSFFREPVLYMSSGQLRFDGEAWKRNQDFRMTSCKHRSALRALRRHLQDVAEAEAERNAASDTEPAAQSEDVSVVSLSGTQPARRRVSPAVYAEGSRINLHWDLVEYALALDNLTDDLVPVMVRSRRFAVVSGTLACLWDFGQHPRLGFVVALLAVYNVGFALAYMSSLPIISRSRRGAEDLRQKVIDRTLSHEDADTWAGLLFRATNWIANESDYSQRFLYGFYGPTPWWCPWFVIEVLKLASL